MLICTTMKRASVILTLLLPVALCAQVPFSIQTQHNLRLPHGLENLSIVDGHLYGFNHLLTSTPIFQSSLLPPQPDTIWAKVIPDADYIIRNPHDSILYFTRRDADGIVNLYTYTPNHFRKTHRINIHGWQRDICHPTFSPNGKMMVFTSKGKVGLGGYDLWCSLWNGHRWTRPINLGNIVNTPGDETYPVFYYNYLIFASDSMPNSLPGTHLYAFYLREASSIDEIIFDSYTIQPLPYPINSDGNDLNITFHLPSKQGWWVSTRRGKHELYSFSGQLDGVMLTGTITDSQNRPLPNSSVRISLNGRTIANTLSDSNGHYQLYVLPNDDYILQASLEGYFYYRQELQIARGNERLLVNNITHNIQLSTPPNDPIIIDNAFGQGADIQISSNGYNALKSIIHSLQNNPNFSATFTLYYDKTNDNAFNNTLIEHRINTLQQYLSSCLSSTSQFSIINGNNNKEFTPSDMKTDIIAITFK